jgi:hypothetical protein
MRPNVIKIPVELPASKRPAAAPASTSHSLCTSQVWSAAQTELGMLLPDCAIFTTIFVSYHRAGTYRYTWPGWRAHIFTSYFQKVTYKTWPRFTFLASQDPSSVAQLTYHLPCIIPLICDTGDVDFRGYDGVSSTSGVTLVLRLGISTQGSRNVTALGFRGYDRACSMLRYRYVSTIYN